MRRIGRWSATVKIAAVFFLLFAVFSPTQSWAAEEVKEVALDFDDVDIRLFIRVISELTGKNFIVDNNVRGKVTVLSPKKLTTKQAYEVFESVLAVNGFTVVETGQVTKIIPAQNMSGHGLPLGTRRLLRGEDQFITQIMPVKYLDAKTLQPLLKPLLSKNGNIFVGPSSDLLITTDYKANIRKIDKLLDEIDIEISNETVEKLDLQYSPASLVAAKITEILDARYGKARTGSRPVFFKVIPLERVNALITVAPPDVFMDIRSVLAKIDTPTPEGSSLLNVYYLENASAEDIVKILTETQKAMTSSRIETTLPQTEQKTEAGGTVVGGQVRGFGKDITITADKSTNSLIIYAKPDDYNTLRDMIQKLDIPRKQVYIQALVMEVSPNEDFRFGTEWSGFRDVGHPVSNQSRAGVVVGSKATGGILDSLVSSEGSIGLGSGFSLGLLGETVEVGGFSFPSLEVLINAMETLETTNILSKPQLMVLNNETATVNVSENRPFQTSSTILEGGGTSQNIEYRDVGIKLEITPHINEKGKIRLEINQEVSKLSGTVATNQPVTLKRTIDTVVEINDGATIVIGGLIEEQRDFSRNSVPCLGGIPYIGWAFKTVGVSDTRTNLLVFISPRVLKSTMDARDVTDEKKGYIDGIRNRQEEMLREERPDFKGYDKKWDKKPQGDEAEK